MSPHAMNTFVSDLVEMARAVETLPQVQAQLDAALKANADLLNDVQRLELKLIDRASEIDALHAKVREAEQARDAAETMFLEETDRTASFKSFVENLFGTAGNLLKASAPPAPVAIPEVEQVQEPARLSDPYEPLYGDPQTEVPAPWDELPPFSAGRSVAVDSEGRPQGKSAVDPTPQTTTISDGDLSGSFGHTTVSEPPIGPYTGKWYSDHPTYVSLPEWLAGGGTEDMYYRTRPQTA